MDALVWPRRVASTRATPTNQRLSAHPADRKILRKMAQVETQAAVPSTVRHFTQQGLTPERVTVAVSIPSSYYEKVWYERNPRRRAPPQKPDATALAAIESTVKGDVETAVVALLPPPPAGTDPFPRAE